jgi:hypothetical protein
MEEALAIGGIVTPRKTTQVESRESARIRTVPSAWIGPARVVIHRLVIVALAAFAILVLLPVAVAAQASVPI